MEAYDAGKDYTTRQLCHAVKDVADRLDGPDRAWLMALIDRAWLLQTLHWPEKVVEEGRTYSVSVHVVDGVSRTIFDVSKPFERTLKYAQKMFDRYGRKVKAVDIRREDDVQRYEPYGEDDAPLQGPLGIGRWGCPQGK